MTLYEKILTYDVDTMAAFIYGLIVQTEEDMLESLAKHNIKVQFANFAPAIRIEMNKQMLLQEVDNGDT